MTSWTERAQADPSVFVEHGGPPAPVLTSIEPAAGIAGEHFMVTLRGEHFFDGMTVEIADDFTCEVVNLIDDTRAEAIVRIPLASDDGAHDLAVTTLGGTSDALALTSSGGTGAPAPAGTFLLDTFTGGPEVLDAHVGETGATWAVIQSIGSNTDGTVENGGVSCESDGVHGLGITPFYAPTGRPAGGRYQVRVRVDRLAPAGTNPTGTVTLALADDFPGFPGFTIQYALAYIQWDDFAGGSVEFDSLDGFAQTIPFTFNAGEEHDVMFVVETDGTVALWIDGVEVASHHDTDFPIPAIPIPIVQVSNFTDAGFEKILRLLEIEGTDL